MSGRVENPKSHRSEGEDAKVPTLEEMAWLDEREQSRGLRPTADWWEAAHRFVPWAIARIRELEADKEFLTEHAKSLHLHRLNVVTEHDARIRELEAQQTILVEALEYYAHQCPNGRDASTGEPVSFDYDEGVRATRALEETVGIGLVPIRREADS